ncbi:MAG: hypothetical protein IH898_12730 [Planctomycetes bacterium]|nr:hypothetical protein [Planctomycetota bacterium]
MNRTLPTLLLAVVAALTHGLPTSQEAIAQTSGYQSPSFYSASMQRGGSFSQSMPPLPAAPLPAAPLPASPLAGGLPAAQGDSYMDAHGQAIVMPTGYCQNCASAGGYCESCAGGFGPGGYGDPMAIDFGGYAADQCGPHYFDVSFGTVFLQGEDFFEGLLPFTSAGLGVTDPMFLDVESGFGEYEPGWEIAVRYDIGPLAVLEATYLGSYDISLFEKVNSVDVAPGNAPNSLFSAFSVYGTDPVGGIPGIGFGVTHSIDYQADLQSTEISYRRYWVGNNPRVSGTWLLGARYLRFTDDFTFNSQGFVNPAVETASLLWSGENDLVGFQLGGDGWICLRQGLRVGCEGTTGIYNNRFKFRHTTTYSADGAPDDLDVNTEGNQIAFAAEGEATVVADILPSWSIRGGYRVLFLNSLVTAENNIDQTDIASTTVQTQAGLLLHGFHGGVEYVW